MRSHFKIVLCRSAEIVVDHRIVVAAGWWVSYFDRVDSLDCLIRQCAS